MADEPVVEAAERPEWLQDKFQSAEDQAKAYAASEAEMHRMRQQNEQERQRFQAALEAQAQVVQQPVIQAQAGGFDPAAAELEQAFAQGDYGAIMRIQSEAAARATVPAVAKLLDGWKDEFTPTLEAQQSAIRQSQIAAGEGIVAQMIGTDEYAKLAPKLSELVADRPNYLPAAASPEGYAAAILDVVKIARYDQLVEDNAEMSKDRAEKLAAQQLAPGGNRSIYTADEQKAEFDRIKNSQTGSFGELLRGT